MDDYNADTRAAGIGREEAALSSAGVRAGGRHCSWQHSQRASPEALRAASLKCNICGNAPWGHVASRLVSFQRFLQPQQRRVVPHKLLEAGSRSPLEERAAAAASPAAAAAGGLWKSARWALRAAANGGGGWWRMRRAMRICRDGSCEAGGGLQ